LNQYDVVIGLGCDLSKDELHASQQSEAVARKCLQHFNEGIARNILFAGGYARGVYPLTEARVMCDIIAWQVPWENIFLEQESQRTYSNADNCIPIIEEEGWSKILVVAQKWHLRRARATFKKRWHGKKLQVDFMGVESGFGGGTQKRWNNVFYFVVWDTLAFIYSKLQGYC